MMKKIYFLLMLLTFLGNAQTPEWQWAHGAGENLNDGFGSAFTDAAGNTYVCGLFESPTITFGSLTLTNAASPNPDFFIVKYNSSGTVVWAKSGGGAGEENAISISGDGSGISVTGYFNSASLTLGSSTLTNSGGRDMFVAKLDGDGNYTWAHSASGTSDDIPEACVMDANGNVAVAGRFSSATFAVNGTTLPNYGIEDFFVVKYDSDGNVLWAKNGKGSRAEEANSIAADPAGNIYIAGHFYSEELIFGTDTLKNTSITNPSTFDPEGIDLFILKYDPAGNLQWAKSAGGNEHEYAEVIRVNNSAVFVAGTFSSSTFTFQNQQLMNSGTNALNDIFVAKLDLSGNMLWAGAINGTNSEYVNAMHLEANGYVNIAGYFSSSLLTAGSVTLNNTGANDIFVARYNAGGTLLSAFAVGNINSEYSKSLTGDMADNYYLSGHYQSPSIPFGNHTVNNNGLYDFFIAKFSMVNVGINDTKTEMAASLFPNPAQNNIHVTLNEPAKTATQIAIYSTSGKKILTSEIEGGKTESNIDISAFSDGIYFIRLTGSVSVITKQIVVLRAN